MTNIFPIILCPENFITFEMSHFLDTAAELFHHFVSIPQKFSRSSVLINVVFRRWRLNSYIPQDELHTRTKWTPARLMTQGRKWTHSIFSPPFVPGSLVFPQSPRRLHFFLLFIYCIDFPPSSVRIKCRPPRKQGVNIVS